MNIKKFIKISLSQKSQSSLADLFKDLGKTLLLGLIVNIFLEVKEITTVQAISAGIVGIEFYLLGMVFEGED